MNDVVGVRYVSDTCHFFLLAFYFKISNLCNILNISLRCTENLTVIYGKNRVEQQMKCFDCCLS